MSAVSVVNEREIQPMQLSLEQLSQLKTQHEDELQELQRQLDSLSTARARFLNARNTLSDMKDAKQGNVLLVPLNQSLYVPGRINDPNKVIVELGTGYFCEKDVPAAQELIDRKMQLVSTSMESIENVGLKKKRNLDQIVQIMQYKVAQAQAQQGAASKK